MDKKSKALFLVLFLSIAAAMAFTYYRIVVRRDYIVEAQTDCDPATEKCFVHHCDPASEECAGDAVADTSYYKISRRKAFMIPPCESGDESCQPFVCDENEADCEVSFCDAQATKNGDECNNPQQYVLDHPPVPEEENVACDPSTDPTCEATPAAETTDKSDASPEGAVPVAPQE
ncbi:MAG: hypothetical protein WCJ25_01245 [Candidatus Moraniibacteriota bacterium]